MKENKLYIVLTPFFPSNNSHVGSYIFDQVQALNKYSDFEIKVIKTVSIFSFEKDYIYNNIQVHIFKVLDFPFFILPGFFNKINGLRFNKFICNNKLNMNFIHGHVCYPSSYLINKIKLKNNTVKTIIQHHGIDVLQTLNCRYKFLRDLQSSKLINRSIKELNLIDLNISVSKRVQKALNNYENYQANNEYVLYNGVDTAKFFNMPKPIKSNKYIIGCIANFIKIKDHINLIKAIESLVNDGFNNLELRLIGTGETFNLCFEYVKRNSLENHVFFEKEQPHDQINKFYNNINLFVLPSYYEASACVLMEAWATNTPIISIHNQGVSELIPENEKEYLLADAKSFISLKEKILGEYKKKREFKFNQKYDIKNTISDFLKLPFFKS
tara:strand:+ start:60 stop:1211 length:1152 start_codon:yes stop_codon:yes gene_type:complete